MHRHERAARRGRFFCGGRLLGDRFGGLRRLRDGQPKRVLTKIPVGVVVGSGMLSGGLVLFIISPPDLAAMHWTVFTAAVYFYIAAFGTVAAFCCYLRSLAFIPAPVASLLACIEPLSAVILGVVLMGLTLNAVEIVGIVIIFTMAVMLARAPKRSGRLSAQTKTPKESQKDRARRRADARCCCACA